jgi:hypothetical protein
MSKLYYVQYQINNETDGELYVLDTGYGTLIELGQIERSAIWDTPEQLNYKDIDDFMSNLTYDAQYKQVL